MRRIAYIGGLFVIFILSLTPWSQVRAACGVEIGSTCSNGRVVCKSSFVLGAGGGLGRQQTTCCDAQKECSTAPEPSTVMNFAQSVCVYAGAKQPQCDTCMKTGSHVWTAIGCIPADTTGFVSALLGFGIGIGGGIAFLLILFGGFQILTSAGNPEQLNGGRELLGSAIAGLFMIIFSIFILKLIGVDILGIPGFK